MKPTTPIPWTVEFFQADHGASLCIVGPNSAVLAVIHPLNADTATDADDAQRDPCDDGNATLMAAAPALLAELVHLVNMHDEIPSMLTAEDWADARKAIAQAKGETA